MIQCLQSLNQKDDINEETIKCPKCQSTNVFSDISCTEMYCSTFKDVDGKIHDHDGNAETKRNKCKHCNNTWNIDIYHVLVGVDGIQLIKRVGIKVFANTKKKKKKIKIKNLNFFQKFYDKKQKFPFAFFNLLTYTMFTIRSRVRLIRRGNSFNGRVGTITRLSGSGNSVIVTLDATNQFKRNEIKVNFEHGSSCLLDLELENTTTPKSCTSTRMINELHAIAEQIKIREEEYKRKDEEWKGKQHAQLFIDKLNKSGEKECIFTYSDIPFSSSNPSTTQCMRNAIAYVKQLDPEVVVQKVQNPSWLVEQSSKPYMGPAWLVERIKK